MFPAAIVLGLVLLSLFGLWLALENKAPPWVVATIVGVVGLLIVGALLVEAITAALLLGV